MTDQKEMDRERDIRLSGWDSGYEECLADVTYYMDAFRKEFTEFARRVAKLGGARMSKPGERCVLQQARDISNAAIHTGDLLFAQASNQNVAVCVLELAELVEGFAEALGVDLAADRWKG